MMEWQHWHWRCVRIVAMLVLLCVAPSAGMQPRPSAVNIPVQGYPEENFMPTTNNNMDEDSTYLDENQDEKLEILGKVLTNILVRPWPHGISPIIYIETEQADVSSDEPEQTNDLLENEDITSVPYKRSRYYRKYPWKRQNSRYDAENRYLCQPSKDDVFRLLVALHEARQGNRGKTIHFCNRKRPASAIFTNIRFLGKRK